MAVLLYLRDEPGNSVSVSQALGIGPQIVEASISRLMRSGLIEVRFGEKSALHMTDAAKEHLKAGSPRINLQGKEVDKVSPEHAEFARQFVKKWKSRQAIRIKNNRGGWGQALSPSGGDSGATFSI